MTGTQTGNRADRYLMKPIFMKQYFSSQDYGL